MIELRQKITQELEDIHTNVFFQKAKETVTFPYMVFNFLPSFMVDKGMESMMMDVDIWDKNTDTTTLELLAQQVWSKFKDYNHVDDTIYLAIYRDGRMPELEEDEPTIRRRKLTFQIRYMYKGGTD